jgi:hypothetical protein
MSPADGFPSEMRRFLDRFDADPLALDEGTAERLLTGSLAPADAPPGYAVVAQVLRAAGGPPELELVGEAEMVGLLATVVCPTPLTPSAPRRSAVLQKCLTAKVATAAFVAGLGLTTALATAGALPGPAQSITSTVLDKVGVSVPNPNDHPGSITAPGETTTTSSTPTTAPASGAGPITPPTSPSPGTGRSNPVTKSSPGGDASTPTTSPSPGLGSPTPLTSSLPGADTSTTMAQGGSNQADDDDANQADDDQADQTDDGQAHQGNDGQVGHDDNPNPSGGPAAGTPPTTIPAGQPNPQPNPAPEGQSAHHDDSQSGQDTHSGAQADQQSGD